MADIRNTSIRFNLGKPTHKKAWEYLQSLDKTQFKSYSHAVAVSVADYFERYYREQTDPYFENREREERFVTQIIESVETALEKTIPNFLTACLVGATRTNSAETVQPVTISANETVSNEIDYEFIGS